MPKELSKDNLDSLSNWLNEQNINLYKVHRELSDAVPVANLLKKYYPKLVDLHNYPPRSNTQLKLINWETFNQKVLVKLGLNQSKAMLEKFAKSTPGAIHVLLYDIMHLDEVSRHRNIKSEHDNEQVSESDDIVMVTINQKLGDEIVPVTKKMIRYSIYEQALLDLQIKDTYLNEAQEKIAHLEDILKLRE